MKQVAQYIYNHQDRPETELIIHGLHDKKGVFLQYTRDQDVSVINDTFRVLGIDPKNLYPETLPLVLWVHIRGNRKSILNEFNKLFFK